MMHHDAANTLLAALAFYSKGVLQQRLVQSMQCGCSLCSRGLEQVPGGDTILTVLRV